MSRRLRYCIAIPIVAALAAAVAISAPPDPADAHGSTQLPASRTYTCRFEMPDNPMCAAAWDANEQALYDWMEVNIGDAAGRHRELIPDGRLCSAGRDKYAAFERPGDWPVTNLVAGGSGVHEIVYHNTAPHSTAYYRLYLTEPTFDARTDSLAWDDLELVYDSGPLEPAQEQRFRVALPSRDTPAILYVVWQRDDSPEAFYACSDVTISGGPSPTTMPPTTTVPTTTPPTPPQPPTSAQPSTTVAPSPPTTSPTTSPAPPPPEGGPFSPVAGIEVSAQTTASWESGRCAVLMVTNTTSSPLEWEAHFTPDGRIDALWNATVTADDASDADLQNSDLVFTGEHWNSRLDGQRWTSFGMCVGF
jgi:chitin-binding protein